jgi:hypothetical protein
LLSRKLSAKLIFIFTTKERRSHDIPAGDPVRDARSPGGVPGKT